MALSTLLLTLTLVMLLWKPLACNGENIGTTLVEGDVYVHVMASIFTEINETGACSAIESETVQLLEAIKWTFQRLNSEDYIPGVTIGVRVSETCGSMEQARKVALGLSAELEANETNMRTVGIIGHDYSSESEAISALFSALPEQYRLVQMSYSATALSLRDRQKYSNFFRLIPPDDLQVETLKGLIQAMDYTYMALIYSDDAYGRGLRDLLKSSISSIDLCIPIDIPLFDNSSNATYLENLLERQLIAASPPVSGVLVFVPYIMTENILTAVQNILHNTTRSPPVFILSEANSYISENNNDTIKGSFVLSPRRKLIQQFEWTDRLFNLSRLYEEVKSNKWLRDMYKDGFECELADNFVDNTCQTKQVNEIQATFPDSSYTQYAIQTALTMAKVVKNTYQQVCGSTGPLCGGFLSLPRSAFVDTANSISVDYDDDFGAFEIDEFKNPDLVTAFNSSAEVVLKTDLPLYEVYNYQTTSCDTDLCQVKVGELNNRGEFQLQRSNIRDYYPSTDRKAQCPEGYSCSTCHDGVNDQSVLFIEGDLYIVGIAPVHEKGTTPLQCGEFKAGGLDIVEAIRFAVKEETLDASVGVIIIDSCNDPQIIQENLLTLHRLGIFKDGTYHPVADQIIGYIGGWTSDVSKAVAEITTRLRIPQISYASTATSLSRRSLYEYFLRIPTPDNQQAKFMVDLAKNNIKTNFVQIMYSKTEYGEGGRDILIERAEEVSICVAQTIGVDETTDITTVVPKLRQQKDAKLVLVFLGSTEVSRLLRTLNDDMEPGEFIFIASEGWGRRFDVNSYTKLVGTITVTSELDINDRFIAEMKDLTIESTNENFWIRPYIEWYFNCYSQWSFNKTSPQACSDSLALDNNNNYSIDVWSSFTERAVNALLNGAKQAMNDYCGTSLAICDALRMNTQGFVDTIRMQTYIESGNSIRIFDDNGDGRAGYLVNVVSNQPGEEYYRIGQINPNSVIFFDENLYTRRGGQVLAYACSGQTKCLECFPVVTTDEEESSLPVGLIVVLVILGILCCVLGAILLYICNKYGCCLKIENGRVKFRDYITPIHDKDTKPPYREGYITPIHEKEDYNYISDSAMDDNRPLPPRRTSSRSDSNSNTFTESPRNRTPSDSGGSRSDQGASGGSRSRITAHPRDNSVSYQRNTNQTTASDSGIDPSEIDLPVDLSVQRSGQHQFSRHSGNQGYLNPINLEEQV